MIDLKGIAVNFLILFFMSIECNIRSVSGGWEIGEGRCIDRDREALLRFKKGLIDEYGVLSSWGGDDDKKECCKWAGVECSNTTGHVIGLQLRSDWSPDYSFVNRLTGKITSALLELHHLNYLDLSGNDFGGNRIPEFIGSMKRLEHLFLYSCNISGSIPPQLGNLTNLRTLDLANNYFVRSENFNWLSRLSSLSKLDLSYSINLSGANWLQQISKLRSLQELSLRNCEVTDITPSASLSVNFSTLSVLELSDNELTSSTIDWLFDKNTSLFRTYPRKVYLINNKLNRLPPNLGQLSNLEHLYVSFNSLEGTITEANLTELHNLKHLELSFNSLTINIKPGWSPPFQLDVLGLACCNMGPHFPKWIQSQRYLTWLDLSCTGMSDEVPKWLWSLSPSLAYLNLSHNQINGTIQRFSSDFIDIFDVSFNKISGSIPLFPPSTSFIHLSTNKFSGSISSICTHQKLQYLRFLDLSSNQFGGDLPSCWVNMTLLLFLNLANNSFSGEIPHALGSLWNLEILQLHGNNLSGQFPSTLKNCKYLKMIDIGGNKFTGNIPAWIGANYKYLIYLILRGNRFYGNIPPEICNLTQIQVLDLSGNHISGNIPQCFDNFISLIEKSTAPRDIGIIYYLMSTSGHSFGEQYIAYALVLWKGRELAYQKTLGLLKLVDLSSNRLSGNIPRAFSSLRGLISLNMSRNSLTGYIDSNIGQMEMLECLDLSRNQLSGEIPIGLARLNFLAVLDLANNNLSGKIPSSTQLQSFNASSYAGNDYLCGPPLPMCPEDSLSPSITNEGGNIKENDDGFLTLSFMEEFFIAMAFGFILGFWGVIGSLLLKKSWRSAYFKFLEAMED